MVEIQRQDYDINPTMRLVDAEGRATGEFFRLLKAVAEIVENITIQDGEITTEMLEAEIIRVSTLFADEVIITGKIAQNAITEVTTAVQVGTKRVTDLYLIQASVPVTSTGNTGVLVSFTAFMRRPTVSGANFGDWRVDLHRNGVTINQTPNLFYDDNFAYPVICAFVDETPGTNPLYEIVPVGVSGPCDFDIEGGLGVFSLLKR